MGKNEPAPGFEIPGRPSPAPRIPVDTHRKPRVNPGFGLAGLCPVGGGTGLYGTEGLFRRFLGFIGTWAASPFPQAVTIRRSCRAFTIPQNTVITVGSTEYFKEEKAADVRGFWNEKSP
jgi:hypothetical protein